MKKTTLSLIIIQLAVFPSVAFATCTHAVGDFVKILSPAVVVEQMSKYALVKDEFETTEEFNARKATLGQFPNRTMIVEASYDPEHVHYDADNERFLIGKWAWSNIGGYFKDSVPSLNRYGYYLQAIGLQWKEKVTGTVLASNAFGKEVEVVKILRTVYGIFDKEIKEDYTNFTTAEKIWAFDFKESGSYSDGNHKRGGIFLPAPRAQAKTLKTGMRFGIEFTPKEPFLFQGEGYHEPTIDSPTEIVAEVSSIVGDIECVLVTDAKGTVLKVVETLH